jgi:ATP-dependent Clp protease adaptor protein ClpS
MSEEQNSIGGVDLKERTDTKARQDRAPISHVILHNDDYTPFEIVLHTLLQFFTKPMEDSAEIMMLAHKNGKAPVGVYTHKEAESRVKEAMDFAKTYKVPLRYTVEKMS